MTDKIFVTIITETLEGGMYANNQRHSARPVSKKPSAQKDLFLSGGS